MEFKFELGATLADQITGFKGIVIGQTKWLSNCNTYGLKAKAKDNKIENAEWFDESQLKLAKSSNIKPKQDTGGPTDTPKQTNR